MSRAHPFVLIRYPIGQKAFKVLNLTTKSIHIARDIKFFENIFPLHDISPTMSQNPHSFLPKNSSDTPIAPSPPSISVPTENVSSSQSQPPNIPRRTSSRTHNPPMHLRYYICNNVIDSSHICCHTVTHMCNVDPQVSVLYPISTFFFNISKHDVGPTFYHQAKGNPHWELAMQQELEALQTNHTWDIVSLPKGKKPISC
ncbi:uncharacterized protein LOC128129155 [Lactuca sativa]|uniref:uncharacterized protein LOC128129155 n=1 Tax=Lactuca sativa TaxID=4236 RepID=UPI0022AF7E88|nr:uncharacterized protein LOC128129155 [Lactuca sativa]